MRAAAILTLGFLCVAGPASAQDPTRSSFTIEPLAAPLGLFMPLGPELVLNWTADLFCPPAVPGASPPALHVWVDPTPSWAHTSVVPDVVTLDACVDQRQTTRGVVKVSVDDTAPAFVAEQFIVGASFLSVTGQNSTIESPYPLSPGYFSILDVQLAESVAVVRPGSAHPFKVQLTNLGNADTLVMVELESIGAGMSADPIEPFTLESRQAGGTDIMRELDLVIHAAEGVGYLNKVGTANFMIRSQSVLNDLEGDESSVSVLLTTRGLDTPAPSSSSLALALALALALVVAISSQRRALRP